MLPHIAPVGKTIKVTQRRIDDDYYEFVLSSGRRHNEGPTGIKKTSVRKLSALSALSVQFSQ